MGDKQSDISTTKAPSRENNINAMRFFAACMVIFGHAEMFIGVTGLPNFFGTTSPGIAVDIFFVLSGYLITKSFFRDSNVLRYAIRRVMRIYPALIAATLFAIVLGLFLTTEGRRVYLTSPITIDYLWNALIPYHSNSLPGVFATNPHPTDVNTSLWTLQYELQCYIATPFIYLILRKLPKGRAVLWAVLALCFVLNVYDAANTNIAWNANYPRLFFFYIAGALAFEYQAEHRIPIQIAFAGLVVVMLVGFNNPVAGVIAGSLIIPPIVISFAFAKNPVFGKVFSKNDYSYGMYVYAFPIQQTVASLMGADFGYWPYLAICLVFTFIASFASWHLVEKPCQKLGKKITARLRERETSRKE